MNGDVVVDRALFAIMLLLPLLPAGPAYLGVDPALSLDLALLALAALLVVPLVGRRAVRAAGDGAASAIVPCSDPVGAAWALFVAAATGAALVGIAADNVIDSPVFGYQLAGAFRLLGPVDRAWEPLLSLNAWLVIVRGLLAYALVRAVIAKASRPRRRARAALAGWLCGFGVVAALAVMQYLAAYRLHPFWVEANPLLTRSHATLDDPNALGSFLALGIFVCIGLTLTKGAPLPRWFAGALAVLGGAALLASGSRSALGAVLVVGLLAAARHSRLRRTAAWALAAILAMVTASLVARLFVPATATDYRPGNIVAAVAGSLDPRVPLSEVLENRGVWWDAALEMWRQHPLLGVGLGRYPRLLATYTDGAAAELDAHSYVLQVAAETGLVGLASLVLLLATVFAVLRWRSGEERSFGVATGVLFGSAAYVATFATGHPLLPASGQVLWGSLLAVAVVGGTVLDRGGFAPVQMPESPREAPRPGSPPHAPTTGAPVGGAPADNTALDRYPDRFPRSIVAVACLALVVLYAVGAARVSGSATDGPWGYEYGLYPAETGAGGETFRWTGPLALLQIEPPAGARTLVAEVVVSPALRSGGPTEVRFFVSRRSPAGGEFAPRDFLVQRFTEDGAFTAVLDLVDGPTGSGDVLLRIEVSPAFVPAQVARSDDLRELGVRLRPPRFAGSR